MELRTILKWPSFEGPRRPRSGPEVALGVSQMRIAGEVDFLRMYLTESRYLKLGWASKKRPKKSAAIFLRDKDSNSGFDHKKQETSVECEKVWNHQKSALFTGF